MSQACLLVLRVIQILISIMDKLAALQNGPLLGCCLAHLEGGPFSSLVPMFLRFRGTPASECFFRDFLTPSPAARQASSSALKAPCCHGSTGSPSTLSGIAHRGHMKRGGGGWLTPESGVRLGGTEGANRLFPMGVKRGVMVLEGGRVLARGTGSCT